MSLGLGNRGSPISHNSSYSAVPALKSSDLSGLKRRDFLAGAASLLGGALAGCAAPAEADHNLPPGRKRLKVVVIGAGMAGLVATYELEKLGHEVALLEADSRHIGGRVRTLRKGELYGEAGAMRIPKGSVGGVSHFLTWKYIKQFGLKTRPFVGPGAANTFVYLRKQKIPWVKTQFETNLDTERAAAAFGLSEPDVKKWSGLSTNAYEEWFEKLRGNDREGICELFSDSLSSPGAKALDISMGDALRASLLKNGITRVDDALAFVMSTEAMNELKHIELTWWLRENYLRVWKDGFEEIVGGMDVLPRHFAKNLKQAPKSGCPVTAISQDESGVKVTYDCKGAQETETGDYAICTIPFSVLRRIRFYPCLSAEKAQAINALNYESSTKVLAFCRQRFWEQQGIVGGGTITDLPTMFTFYPSDNSEKRDAAVSRGPGVMLASYTWGDPGKKLGELSDDKIGTAIREHVGQFHPEIAREGMIEHMPIWRWDQWEWSRGAFALPLPGQQTHLHSIVTKPENRIYFAGEHASHYQGWIHGALSSGLRAVREMLIASRG